jgi:hypothetical protein
MLLLDDSRQFLMFFLFFLSVSIAIGVRLGEPKKLNLKNGLTSDLSIGFRAVKKEMVVRRERRKKIYMFKKQKTK